MKGKYRGYEINAWREKCLAGYPLIYYYVMRESDGWFALDGYSEEDTTIREFFAGLKQRIDAEHREEDPWEERADLADFNQAHVACYAVEPRAQAD